MADGVFRIRARPPASSFVPTNLIPSETLLSGTPNERGFTQFVSDDGKVDAGVWACDTYEERIPSYPGDELMVVIEGYVTLTVDGGEPETYAPGDAFVIHRGTACLFKVDGPFLKYWMTYEG
jgi:hypothetical protein